MIVGEEKGALEEFQETAPAERATQPKHNLPAPLTSFVGRRRELDEVTNLLEQSRLLTLTGPAGTGKTRLALQIEVLALRHQLAVYQRTGQRPRLQPADRAAEVYGFWEFASVHPGVDCRSRQAGGPNDLR